MSIECIGRADLDAEQLMRGYPPRFANERKRELVARITAPITGALSVSRWRGALPEMAVAASDPEVELVERHFDYLADDSEVVRWYLNFAHSELFVAYPGSLLAQDELQVLEHPVLGAVREVLAAREGQTDAVIPQTRDAGGPTPILIRGAIRSLALDTRQGLYGNAFSRADPERILAATTFLDPPTVSNIVAMEAPPGGYGLYDPDTIEDILLTAFIGFGACIGESSPAQAEIHTGGWGTGAYGGDPTLMALLQLVAARLAGVPRLVYHSLSAADAFRDAKRLATELPFGGPTSVLVDAVMAHGFEWGESDGN